MNKKDPHLITKGWLNPSEEDDFLLNGLIIITSFFLGMQITREYIEQNVQYFC